MSDGHASGRRTGANGVPRILFLTQVVPYPLDAGPKVRAYHVLGWLARRAAVDLVTFVREDDPPAALDHLRHVCATVRTVPMRRSPWRDARHLAAALARGGSFIVGRDTVGAMHDVVHRLVRHTAYAAIHADQLSMAAYAANVPGTFRVLDDHNAVYRVFERLADHERAPLRRALLRREARLIARYEARQIRAFDRLLFVSTDDRDAVRRVADGACARGLDARAAVLPICVDVAAVRPVAVRPDAHRVTVLGTMYWPPNVEGSRWFLREVWPDVVSRCPGAVLTIIGKAPPASLRALAGARSGSVEVVGYVPDPTPYLEQTAVFVVPLLSGGGMRVKILDAWAWGLPVVSTRLGAEGIDARHGDDLLLADDPPVLADAIVGLLRDPARRAALGAAGRNAAVSRYDARRVYDRLAGIYATVLGQSASGAP